ncbi:hypothetical protein BS78_10G078700 [Paspalum vaginatum]|nr:hypothetical protein BS78_10G078700 [Paspalum vaginatum]
MLPAAKVSTPRHDTAAAPRTRPPRPMAARRRQGGGIRRLRPLPRRRGRRRSSCCFGPCLWRCCGTLVQCRL